MSKHSALGTNPSTALNTTTSQESSPHDTTRRICDLHSCTLVISPSSTQDFSNAVLRPVPSCWSVNSPYEAAVQTAVGAVKHSDPELVAACETTTGQHGQSSVQNFTNLSPHPIPEVDQQRDPLFASSWTWENAVQGRTVEQNEPVVHGPNNFSFSRSCRSCMSTSDIVGEMLRRKVS